MCTSVLLWENVLWKLKTQLKICKPFLKYALKNFKTAFAFNIKKNQDKIIIILNKNKYDSV